MREVYVKDKKVLFKESTSKNLWYGDFEIKGEDVNIEFYSDKAGFTWNDLSSFLTYINKEKYPFEKLLMQSQDLLLKLACVFWNKNEACFKFDFSGINYNGLGTSFSRDSFNYEFVFDLLNANGEGVDDYDASWIIELSDKKITGMRRA